MGTRQPQALWWCQAGRRPRRKPGTSGRNSRNIDPTVTLGRWQSHQVQVRRYAPEDRDQVWALNHIPFRGHTADPSMPLPLPPATDPGHFADLHDVQESFLDAGGEFLVVELDGAVVGMGGIRPTDPGRAEVLRVRVHPATRRLGVGRALMGELEARARDLGIAELVLETTVEQPEAIAFYSGLGYRETGRRLVPDWELVFFSKSLVTGTPDRSG